MYIAAMAWCCIALAFSTDLFRPFWGGYISRCFSFFFIRMPLCHLRIKSASSEAAWKERGQSDAIEPCINSQSTCFTHLASHKSPLSSSPHKQSLPFKHLDHKRLVIKYSKYLQIFPKLSIPNTQSNLKKDQIALHSKLNEKVRVDLRKQNSPAQALARISPDVEKLQTLQNSRLPKLLQPSGSRNILFDVLVQLSCSSSEHPDFSL